MNPKIIAGTVIAALLMAGSALSAPQSPDNGTTPTTPPATPPITPSYLTAQEAEAAALSHSGLTASEVTGLRSHKDLEHTRVEWDVEFRYEDWEYDYDLDAQTGEVLHWDREYEPAEHPRTPTVPPTEIPTEPPTVPPAEPPVQPAAAAQPPAGNEAKAPAASGDRLTKEEAKNIALNHAGLTADQVTRLRAEFDWDDGSPEYEVDFHSGGYEYEYTIHGETGKILEWDKEWDD